MTDLANLAAALVAFQADMPTVKKAQKATVPTKSGGSYSYTYAGLADVMRVAMPLLTQHGLAFTSLPKIGERGYELHGTLLHSSGESLVGTLPIAGNTPQEMGSSLTYMRRYLFGCLTGLVTDDDDDGAAATRAAREPAVKRAAPARKPVQEAIATAQASAARETGELMKPGTRARMFALFGEAGITDRDEQIRGITHIVGRTIESRGELLDLEARKVISTLEQRLGGAQ